tara:strand:+ start:878 stop:1768 length:891 start_codon:yes stop_codon:yes gene_type:complete
MNNFSNFKFFCYKCDFYSNKKTDYNRHLQSQKHQLNETNEYDYKCKNCNKYYKTKSGLWKHLKKCEFINNNVNNNNIKKDIINELLIQNKDLQDKLMKQNNDVDRLEKACNKILEIAPNLKGGHTFNQTNNINVFLNTHCPDALNLSEFIELIQENVSQYLPKSNKLLENNFEDNITVVITENYKEIDPDKKPYYLMDIKRNKLIVKNNDTWIDMTPEDDNLHEEIKKCERSITKEIQKNFHDEYPNFLNNEKDKDQFIKVLNHSTSDIGTHERKKIIKGMCKLGINTKKLKEINL